ncbi:MAG: hypothetical protein Q7T03_05255 [Deltaproteobacteria bacterium]|nr:hypothetical protein [Deltaproteobacteria bacterium]
MTMQLSMYASGLLLGSEGIVRAVSLNPGEPVLDPLWREGTHLNFVAGVLEKELAGEGFHVFLEYFDVEKIGLSARRMTSALHGIPDLVFAEVAATVKRKLDAVDHPHTPRILNETENSKVVKPVPSMSTTFFVSALTFVGARLEKIGLVSQANRFYVWQARELEGVGAYRPASIAWNSAARTDWSKGILDENHPRTQARLNQGRDLLNFVVGLEQDVEIQAVENFYSKKDIPALRRLVGVLEEASRAYATAGHHGMELYVLRKLVSLHERFGQYHDAAKVSLRMARLYDLHLKNYPKAAEVYDRTAVLFGMDTKLSDQDRRAEILANRERANYMRGKAAKAA